MVEEVDAEEMEATLSAGRWFHIEVNRAANQRLRRWNANCGRVTSNRCPRNPGGDALFYYRIHYEINSFLSISFLDCMIMHVLLYPTSDFSRTMRAESA